MQDVSGQWTNNEMLDATIMRKSKHFPEIYRTKHKYFIFQTQCYQRLVDRLSMIEIHALQQRILCRMNDYMSFTLTKTATAQR